MVITNLTNIKVNIIRRFDIETQNDLKMLLKQTTLSLSRFISSLEQLLKNIHCLTDPSFQSFLSSYQSLHKSYNLFSNSQKQGIQKLQKHISRSYFLSYSINSVVEYKSTLIHLIKKLIKNNNHFYIITLKHLQKHLSLKVKYLNLIDIIFSDFNYNDEQRNYRNFILTDLNMLLNIINQEIKNKLSVFTNNLLFSYSDFINLITQAQNLLQSANQLISNHYSFFDKNTFLKLLIHNGGISLNNNDVISQLLELFANIDINIPIEVDIFVE